MDASHILVGGLTAISIALLVWIEIRSRRNAAAPEQNSSPVDSDEARSHHRRNETAHSKESIMAEWVFIALIVLALTILVLNGLIFQHARRPKCGRLPLDEHYC